MVWFIVIVIVVIILFSFFSSLNKDKTDLHGKTAADKFKTVVYCINKHAFNGQGQVKVFDTRSFNLYQTGENQIIYFEYSTGHLTITWKYKYFQKEVEHKRIFREVRNLSLFEQDSLAKVMIKEMNAVIEKHKIDVISVVQEIPEPTPIPTATKTIDSIKKVYNFDKVKWVFNDDEVLQELHFINGNSEPEILKKDVEFDMGNIWIVSAHKSINEIISHLNYSRIHFPQKEGSAFLLENGKILIKGWDENDVINCQIDNETKRLEDKLLARKEHFRQFQKEELKKELNGLLEKTFINAQKHPVEFQSIIIIEASNIFCKNYISKYPQMRSQVKSDITLSDKEFGDLIKEVNYEVLSQYIEFPKNNTAYDEHE